MSNLSSMKLGIVGAAVLTSIICAPLRCSAEPPKQADDATTLAISTQYAQINDAILKHDVDKIMSYFTSDFTEVNSTGALVDRDQERKEYESQLEKIKSMEIHYSIENCDLTPSGTCCDVKFHMDGVGFKRVLFMKIQGAFTNDLMVHDVWVPTPDGLRLKSRQCLLDETKIESP